ncbi:carbohydrate binding domain-containing protein [Hamadaea tsunoensis]|uniref:carbohydrate binding domain-containing protein n=1 Tax=Hamadaea tsunoensis TaxID=53368 RepID=UPI000420EE35|nr:carbohydrate binding domain-containing protein [Hamadaea tsunoensis]
MRSRYPAAFLAALLALVLVPLTALAGRSVAANAVTVYYHPSSSWTTVDIHYAPTGGSWTAVPGVPMTAACTGWYVKTIDLGTATGAQVVFNNGSGTWDNHSGANYSVATGTAQINNGVVGTTDPCATTSPSPSPSTAGNQATVFYHAPSGWTTVDIHYAPTGGSWTTAPGVPMAAASCSGWYVKTINLGTATGAQVVFNNGSGTWDNHSGANYSVGTGTVTVNNGVVGTGDPCTVVPPTPGSNTATVFYYTKTRAWSAVDIHYAPDGEAWTTVPGVAMNETACTDWVKKTVALGSATKMQAVFNNGSGSWDNNNGANYSINAGTSLVRDGVVTGSATDPCAAVPPDTTAPTAPANVTASADHVTITLAWTPSTDDRGVTGYQITRTGGSGGSVVLTTAYNTYIDASLAALTAYTYVIKAVDAAGNLSAASAAVSATTGDTPPPASSGTMLGGDPRKESIYFVLTARFYDGDTSNDRGGSQNVSSGNAANNDPMFRGDFKGLIDKLDYIKALGFSAIWITPVVLNRSDYDYHGYHGWDFYRVDDRLESPGAGYQDLINDAHAKGLKIFQDVVYNHSSRWGANGLFVPKVWGAKDGQWDWLYSTKVAGGVYDPMVEFHGTDPNMTPTQNALAQGRAYNGDLWTTTEPAGNTCRNWGTPTGTYSPEGFALHNCQWPSPTSGMFPANLYHQCWIGNWEGEDSRSCWLADDLADFNTENPVVQNYLIGAYNKYIDMGVDGFRVDTAVHIPRVTWNRRFLPALQQHLVQKYGAAKAQDFFVFAEVAAFVNDKWNRGSVNHSAQFYTWKERKTYVDDDVQAALDQYNYEEQLGTGSQPTSTNAFLSGNTYHAPDHSQASGMNIIDMRMHMNFGDAGNAFRNGKDSDDSTNDATYNVVYVDSHDYGPNKSSVRYAGGTTAWAENMDLMWTFRGVPTLYYGSEIEFQAGKQIDCGPTCPLATTGRAYYGDHLEGTITAAGYGVVGSATGAVASTMSMPLVQHVQRLNLIRRAIPALQMGQYSTDGVSGPIAYKRRYTNGSVDSFALVAVSSSSTFTGVPNGTYTDAVTGDVQVVTNGTLTATVSAQGDMKVYVLSLPGNPAPGKIGTNGPYLN